MRNKLLLLLLLLLPAWVAWAQAPVWQNVSGITGTATTVRGSALAANGDYYIVGSYTGSADFGNGKSLTSSDQTTTDGFLARISGTTNLCTWAVSMGGTSGGDEVRGVAVNGSTVYITGYYNSSASFFNTSNTGSQSLTAVVNPTTGTGSVDVFVAKYDENGNPLGSISGGGTSSDQGYSIAVNGTSIYITGFITTSTSTSTNVKFGTVTLGNSGSQDMFVARFTDNGTLAHGGALSGGGTGLDRGNAIGVGTNGIYVAGYLTGTSATIGGTALTGAGSNDIYVAKFTDSGSGLNNGGAVRSGGANSDQATALTVSGTSIYVGGFFNQNATATGSVSISGSALSSDNRDLFLAKYTDSGSGLSSGYAIRDGSGNVESVNDLALSGSTVYVVGGYTTAATIAGNNLTSNGDDAYVAKYTDTGTTFSAIGAIDGGASAGGTASTGVSTVSVSGNQVVLGGFLGSPATFAPAVTGTITVPANNSGFFARLAQAPVLTSISPNAGPVGASVTLTGTNLTGATVVTFSGTSNNTVASVTVNGTGTQTITVNVPTGATTGNVTVTTPAGTSNGVVFTVQQPTTVTSIVRASSNPTNATTVNYTVTFGAPVTGLTASNFTLTTTGSVSGASIGTPVSTGTGSTWTVPVATGTGTGTLTLNLANATNLSPGISTTLPFAGETYTIDKTAPTVAISSSTATSGSTTTTTPFAFTVTFSESVTGFGASDVSVSNGTVSGFSGSGATYTFTVTPTTAGTATTVNVPANVAQDLATNGNTAASQYSLTYQTPSVTVVSVTRLTPSPTATAQVRYQVVFSGSVTNLTTNNFTVTTTGSISGTSISSTSGSGTTYTVTVNTGTGDGTLRLNVANGTGVSPTITNVPYVSGETYTITKSFAANPQLTIQGTGGTGSDVTAFVDAVQVLNGGTAVANALRNGSFEQHDPLANGDYGYQPTNASWTFNAQSGIAEDGSAFTPITPIPNGIAVAFVQSNGGGNGQLQQNLAVPTGSYQVNFQVAQRLCCTTLDQSLNVFINGVFVGNILPGTNGYTAFTSATFNVTAPALTATVSTTSTSPTSTAPVPFSVSFSQSVGTTFTASDVTVTGGTITSGSFSGSGSGPYTFTVTPTGTGTISVVVAAGVATDSNNTPNSASNSLSLQYSQPVTAAPVVTAPANGSFSNVRSVTATGTAPAGSTVSVYIGSNLAGTTPASATGTFSYVIPGNAPDGTYTVSATAQSSGASTSASSNVNTFTIDGTAPTVALSSATVASGSSTSTSPVSFTATFNEPVLNFTSSGITVTNGTVTSGPTAGSGNAYTFQVTPSTAGNVTVTVPANAAKDRAGNNNTASSQYAFTFVAPTITVAPASLPNGTQGTAYSQALSASGGSGTYTFAITAGTLPSGLTLTSAGTLAGTPTTNGSFNFTVTATDASAAPGPYSGSRAYTLTIDSQPVTAAPVIIVPANGSFVSTPTPTYGGTAPAGSLIRLYVDGVVLANTTTANSAGNWALTQPAALAQGSHTVYATAQTNGSAVSANSATNTFTVDSVRPSVAISSSTATSGSTTSTSPFAYTVTFSEAVTGFVAGDVTVSNGTLSGFTRVSGSVYTFNVTPTTASTSTTINVVANVAQDQAGNGNTAAASAYSLTFVTPTIVVAPASLPNGTQAAAYSQTLTASGGTAPYTFAITAGALPAGLTLTSAGTLTGTPTANGSFNFTVTATDASAAPGPYSGSRAYTLTIAAPVVTVVTWTGNISSDWFTAGNWSPNSVPSSSISATIPTAPSGGRFPNISEGTANVRNFTLNSGASLVQSGGTLVVAGDLTNNGTYQPTGGTVVLGNSARSSILGSSNTQFWNLTVSVNGAQQSTSASTSVQRVLSLNGGSFATNGNSFTLVSNATGTAMVVNNNGVVNGNVTVQRYIDPSLNPNLGYRHITTAVSGQTVSSLATASFSPVVNPAYNASAQPGTVTPFPTVYGYDQSRLATATNNLSTFDKGWFSPNALSDALNVGQGYTALISGGQTWAFTGPLNNGPQTLTLARNTGATASESGLSLVGNPYPSPLDWRQVASSGLSSVDGALYVFQSNDPSNPYAGSYGVYANGVGTANPVLAQGQGFFVRVTQGQSSGTLTFDNSQRPTTYTATNYARTAAETRPLVQLSLKAAGRSTSDDAFVYFEQGATEGFDAQYDAMKMSNPSGLNLSTSVAGQQLSIDARPAVGTVQRVIPLAVGVPAAGAYSLSTAQLLNLDTTPVYLRDLQAGTLTDLRLTPSYQFTVSNASALLTNRFELVFSPQQALATVPAALAQQVALYPNPAKKAAFVELPASLGRQAVTATLVDALGRSVRTVSLPAQGALAHQLDLSELATGVYALRLTTSSGVVVKKLVIE